MKGKKYSAEDKIRILRQADGGRSIWSVPGGEHLGSDVPPVEESVWADGSQRGFASISPPSGNPLAEVMDLHYLFDMAMILEAEANLTAQNQITIPAAVRKVLNLRGGQSRIRFQILPEEGRVMVIRVEPTAEEPEDPALKPFLALLTKDIIQRPQRIAPFPAPLLKKARSLVKGVEVDLDGPLTGED